MMTRGEFWVKFLKTSGKGPETTYRNSYHFAMDEKTSDELLDLIIKGEKKGSASCFLAYQATGEKPPNPEDYNIITDWQGTPTAVIKTSSVFVLPFKDVGQDIVDREGEGMSLEDWRKEHRKLFLKEGEKLGYEFTDESPIVFEMFDMVYSDKAK